MMETKLTTNSGNVNTIVKKNTRRKTAVPKAKKITTAPSISGSIPGLLTKEEFTEQLKKANLFHENNGICMSENEFVKLIAHNATLIDDVEISGSDAKDTYRETDWLNVYMVRFERKITNRGDLEMMDTSFYIRNEFKTFRANSIEGILEIVANLRLLWYEDYQEDTGSDAYETYKAQKILEKEAEALQFTRRGELIE